MNHSQKKTIALCFWIQAVGIGIYIAFGVFLTPLEQAFGWPRALVAGASSTAFFVSGLFAVAAGRLNDRAGPGTIMAVTGFLFGAGLVLVSRVQSPWQLYLFFGLVFGAGLSSVDVIALTTIARWFPHRRGAVTGVVKVGTGAGQFFFPFAASLLISGLGWRNAFVILGVFAFAALTATGLGLKRDPGRGSVPSAGSGRTPPRENGLSFGRALCSRSLWLVCTVNFIIVSCLMSTLVHVVPFGRDLGIEFHRAASVLSMIGGVSMAGRFGAGLVVDRAGSRGTMRLALAVMAVSMAWLQYCSSLTDLYLFAVVYGLAHGGIFTAISPLVAEVFGTLNHGAIFGLVVFSGTTGGAVGPFLAGWLFDLTGSYRLPFGLMLGLTLLGGGLFMLLKPAEGSGDDRSSGSGQTQKT